MSNTKSFKLAQDAIDPGRVPFMELPGGARIPMVGMGTFGSDHITPDQVAEAVKEAVAMGYRHIDCASVYGNEKEIGAALKEIFESGAVKREEMWITSKVWNDMHDNVEESCRKSLDDLGLDYLDLYLVHWPFPNHHPAGCDIDSRNPDAKPYIHKDYMNTWGQMEGLVDKGLVKHIGTSNMTVPKLELLLKDARIKPVCNEMELHPHFQQQELFDYVTSNGIVPIGYCPIGSPNRPERDRTTEDTVDIEDPVLTDIAAAHEIHPAVACIKWAIQRGQIPIPFSTKRRNLYTNLQCSVSTPFTEKEMEALSEIDRGCRLIKGHVFLWKDDQTWEALWDLSGEITPA